ncbi:membrane or secreted protein [Paucihalobacter sp.]|uniref:membrane or secreted protein n=1 Tax=Paucihalobacter sp. TaxID=2850405 RepID=UPI002FE03D2D
MKTFITFILFAFCCIGIKAQSVIGAWEHSFTADDRSMLTSILIFADGYQAITTYNANTGDFIYTNGGTWHLEGDMLIETIEFDTDHPERVGEEISFEVKVSDSLFTLVDNGQQFKRLDDGTPGSLQGAWLMSGRMCDGETQLRDTNRPRKTMKILSGTRFQWIAYNTETREFMGTGGGTYTTVNGNYTESIEFFSRDVRRVGNSLVFKYELLEGNWHHSGLSSKGEPIYEIWGIRE